MESKRKSDIILAYRELVFQIDEKNKCEEELVTANKELAWQNAEIEQREAELILANKELAFQNEEKEKRASELILANEELAFQNEEKEKRASELTSAYKELKETEEHLKEHIGVLEEMMFMISHKVRQPITSILGLSKLLEQPVNSKEEQDKLISYIKVSALSLDTFTRELTTLMSDLERKGKR